MDNINRLSIPDAIRDEVRKIVEDERRILKLTQGSRDGSSEGNIELEQSFLPQEEVESAMTSEQDGDARLFIVLNQDHLCFDHAAARWFKWNDHFWIEDRKNEALTATEKVLAVYKEAVKRLNWRRLTSAKQGKIHEEKEDAALIGRYMRKIGLLQKIQWKQAVLTLAAAGEKSLGITGDEWDADPWLLGCENGVLDLKTGILRAGKQSDYLKTVCPTEWKGLDEKAPTWEKFLADTFNSDMELIRYLQRLFGYAITGLTTEHIFPIMWGQGRNGKGTLLETLHHVLGAISGPIQAEMLLDQKFSASSAGPRSDIISLRGRRLAWASETDEGRKLNIGKVKWLSGGDTLTAREPYGKREVSFKATHTLFLLTNHRPRVDGNEYAVWKRLILIPFEFSFVDNPEKANERKRDPQLPEKLKAEASGIIAWLVRGCLAWQKEGLSPPQVVRDATAEYQGEEDIMGHFLDACCHINPKYRVSAGALYKEYQVWCDENGHRPLSATKFGKRLKDRFQSETSGCVYYLGLALKTGR